MSEATRGELEEAIVCFLFAEVKLIACQEERDSILTGMCSGIDTAYWHQQALASRAFSAPYQKELEDDLPFQSERVARLRERWDAEVRQMGQQRPQVAIAPAPAPASVSVPAPPPVSVSVTSASALVTAPSTQRRQSKQEPAARFACSICMGNGIKQDWDRRQLVDNHAARQHPNQQYWSVHVGYRVRNRAV